MLWLSQGERITTLGCPPSALTSISTDQFPRSP